MALTVEQAIEAVCRAAGELGWEPSYTSYDQADHDSDGNRIGDPVTNTSFEFANRTHIASHSAVAPGFMEGADIGSLLDSLDEVENGFDPDYEAETLIREVGLGKKGLPSSVMELMSDIEDVKAMLINFANQMRQELEHLTGNGDGEEM